MRMPANARIQANSANDTWIVARGKDKESLLVRGVVVVKPYLAM